MNRGGESRFQVATVYRIFSERMALISADILALKNPKLTLAEYDEALQRWSRHPQARYFIEALCDIQRPYRVMPGMPQIPAAVPVSPYLRLIPEGAAPSAPYETPIRIGQFYYSVMELERCYSEAESRLVILDGGRGYRTGLLGLCAASKGGIRLFGASLAEHVPRSYEKLRMALGPGHLVLASADDLLQLCDQDLDAMVRGAADSDFFYFDLPDSGRAFSPFNEQDREAYISDSRFPEVLASYLGLPVDQARQLVSFLPYGDCTADESDLLSRRRGSPGWSSLLTYGADLAHGGLITPFVFILSSRTVIRDLATIAESIPEAARPLVGWHDFLLYGLKMDARRWDIYRPEGIDGEQWRLCRLAIKRFGAKHGIDTADHGQCEARVFKGHWQSFNFATSFLDYIEERGTVLPVARSQVPPVSLFCDHDGSGPITIEASRACRVGLQDCHIAGTLRLRDPGWNIPGNPYSDAALLYGIDLPSGADLIIPLGHCLSRVGEAIYAMPLFNPTKAYQEGTPVWKYSDTGRARQPERIPCGDFARVYRERWG